jgi:hypothetical protein
MHGEDDLELPGGGGQMNNFRRNPMVDSPWAGGMHRVLIEHGILRKLQVNQTRPTPPQILIEGQGTLKMSHATSKIPHHRTVVSGTDWHIPTVSVSDHIFIAWAKL